eukprot:8853400-Alexandrium_andersonii.AAC.1
MSASLVGSEMCIRDSFGVNADRCRSLPRGCLNGRLEFKGHTSMLVKAVQLWFSRCARRATLADAP